MDNEDHKHFKVREAPSAKFYVTRQKRLCTREGKLLYFETEPMLGNSWQNRDILLNPASDHISLLHRASRSANRNGGM